MTLILAGKNDQFHLWLIIIELELGLVFKTWIQTRVLLIKNWIQNQVPILFMCEIGIEIHVMTLALSLWPRQGREKMQIETVT
jgi:hypothetical protein